MCPGGGFGPVSDKGYGVSYMIPGDHHLFFHVSSKKSAKTTDPRRFTDNLFKSFAEMRALFENVVATQTPISMKNSDVNQLRKDVHNSGEQVSA